MADEDETPAKTRGFSKDESANPTITDLATYSPGTSNANTINQKTANTIINNSTNNTTIINPESINPSNSYPAAFNSLAILTPDSSTPRTADPETIKSEIVDVVTNNLIASIKDDSSPSTSNPQAIYAATSNPVTTESTTTDPFTWSPVTFNSLPSVSARSGPEIAIPKIMKPLTTDPVSLVSDSFSPTNPEIAHTENFVPEKSVPEIINQRTEHRVSSDPPSTRIEADNLVISILEAAFQETFNRVSSTPATLLTSNPDASNLTNTTPITSNVVSGYAATSSPRPPNPSTDNQGTSNQESANMTTPSNKNTNQNTDVPVTTNPVAPDPGPSKPGGEDDSNSEDESHDDIELDADMLETVLYYLGAFGTYQKFLFVAMIPFAVFFAWVYFAPMFVVATPRPFWCYVPELSSLSKEMRRDLTAPGCMHQEWDGCQVFDTDWKVVLTTKKPPPPRTPMKECTTGWEFEYTEIPYPTVVSERGWVCKEASHVPTAQSIFFTGSLLGGLIFGWLADTYGRLPALMSVNLLGGLSGIATVYTRGVWDYYACRFFCGASFDNCIMITYILVLEYVGPSHRTLVATMPIALYYGSSAVALPWIAYFLANWRAFVWVTSLPMLIVIIAPWTIPESARWLVSKGRVDEAVKVLKKFERINKAKVPVRVMNLFIASSKVASNQKQEVFMSMFKSALLRTTAIFMTLTYCICACVYDVIVRLSESFGLNFFITFTINAAAEIPSVLLVAVLLDRLGRRNLTWGPMTIAAVCSIIASFVPKGIIRVLFAVIARFFINLSLTVAVQWGTEILPTPFRATGSAALHMSGFASSCLSPFIVYSERVTPALPLIIVCVLSLISAGCSLTLPETKGLEMPQTIADAETIILEYSLFRKSKELQLKKVFKGIAEPVHRSKEGRVSLILSGTSKSHHSKLNMLDMPKNP